MKSLISQMLDLLEQVAALQKKIEGLSMASPDKNDLLDDLSIIKEKINGI